MHGRNLGSDVSQLLVQGGDDGLRGGGAGGGGGGGDVVDALLDALDPLRHRVQLGVEAGPAHLLLVGRRRRLGPQRRQLLLHAEGRRRHLVLQLAQLLVEAGEPLLDGGEAVLALVLPEAALDGVDGAGHVVDGLAGLGLVADHALEAPALVLLLLDEGLLQGLQHGHLLLDLVEDGELLVDGVQPTLEEAELQCIMFISQVFTFNEVRT